MPADTTAGDRGRVGTTAEVLPQARGGQNEPDGSDRSAGIDQMV